MSKTRSTVAVWFELPVRDFARAIAFYETMMGVTLIREDMGPYGQLAVFPYEEPSVPGCLLFRPGFEPVEGGPILYLNADSGLEAMVARGLAAGGTEVVGITTLPPGMGRYAQLRDSEGTVIGLHSAT